MNGPEILFEIDIFGGIQVSETMRNMWIVVAVISILAIILGSNLKKIPTGKQRIAELIVKSAYGLVEQTMGKNKSHWTPYIGTLMAFSAISSLTGLVGLRQPTADFNVTFAMALATFVMIQTAKIYHHGVKGYIKGFGDPIVFMSPLNIISEVALPISMGFRHFGNIVSGVIISTLLYQALSGLSTAVGLTIPIFQIGIPAVLSLYFDLFAAGMQAFIFCMLTMVFIAMAE